MTQSVTAARKRASKLSLSVLSSNIVLSSLLAVTPLFSQIASATTTSLAAISVGNFDQWVANSGTKVAAIATDDSDTLYISESTNGEKQSFVFANAGISPGAVVNSVTLNVRTKRDGGSNSAIRLFVEKGTGGADYDEGSNKTAGSSYSTASQTWNTNPFTSSDWTAAEVNAWTSRFGVRLNDADAARVTYAEVVVDYTVFTCNGLDATIVGTTGGETINGTAGDDVIVGRGGTDTINGNGGNDTICGGANNDTITTDGGNDWIDAGDGTNNVNAGSGNNTVTGGSGNDTITTDDGNDTIDGGNGTNVIVAGNGTNVIIAGSGNDTITTGSDNDTIDAGNGTNVVNAGDGDNTVTGGSGNDTVTTGSGNDIINVGNGTNNVTAGDGDDSITGGTGNDTLNGGNGNDYINTGTGGTDNPSNGEASGTQGIAIVAVDTTPDTPGQAFDFTGMTGPFSVNGEDSMAFVLSAGSYSAIQSGEVGWTLDTITCTADTGTSGNVGSSTASFDLDAGDVLTCTFANSTVVSVDPKLTVTKVVVNDDGGTKVVGDFDIKVDATSVTSGVQNSYAAGTYTIGEVADSGYAATVSGDCAPDGSITMSDNNTYSCTITNDDIAPTLTLVKQVTNDNGGLKVIADFPLFIDGNSVTSGNPVTLSGGLHTASETADPQYQPSDWTGDCAVDGTITLLPGENKTCYVTNDDISAQITVTVSVTNDNGGTMTGSAVTPTIDTSAVVDGAANPVLVGAHTIDGTSLTGYTKVIGGDCASDGSITVDLADVKTCSITYDDIQPLLTVTKVVVNDAGGTKVVADFPLFVDAVSVTSGVQAGFNVGSYTVSETTDAGYAATITGDCASDGSITLALGETKSCTITNDDIAPTLTLTKVVVNDNGGVQIVTDFPLYIDGNPVTSGASNVVMAGAHVVSEDSSSQYQDVITGDCDGSGSIVLSLAQNATCYITNDDKPAHIIVIKDVVNDNGGTLLASDFTMYVSGNNPDQSSFAGSDTGVDVTIDAGSYDVTEDVVFGYTPSYSADCSGSILPGETKTCTITNDDIQPLITVTKIVINDDTDNTSVVAGYPLFVDGYSVTSGVQAGFDAGTYTVSEIGDSFHTTTFTGDCAADGSITLAIGMSYSCTITNDDIAGLDDDEPEEDVGTGTNRGSGTQRLSYIANFVTGNAFGSIAPGAFGGASDVPFSSEETNVICAMQESLPDDAGNGVIEWIAGYLATILNRDAEMLVDALKDSTLCVKEIPQAKAPAKPVAFNVNIHGFPVSSNETWNKCLTGKITLQDIRANTDKDEDGIARDCSDYHTANLWYHPDLKMYFTFDRKKKVVGVPKGYIVKKDEAVTQK